MSAALSSVMRRRRVADTSAGAPTLSALAFDRFHPHCCTERVDELGVAVLEPHQLGPGEVVAGRLEAVVVDVERLVVERLDLVLGSQREHPDLVVADHPRVHPGVVVDLVERTSGRTLALLLLEVRDGPLDRVAQQGEDPQRPVEQLGGEEREVAGVDADLLVALRGQLEQPVDAELGQHQVAVDRALGIALVRRERVVHVGPDGRATRLHHVDEEERGLLHGEGGG